MCFTEGKQSTRHYEEAARPSRPVAPVYKADRWEKPRKAPLAPPNPQARKRAEAHVKQSLRDAEKVESNRHNKRFATSNSKADKIRESALARANDNRARAPRPPPPRPVVDDDDSSAYPAPLNIRKRTPQPPPPPPKQQHQQHSVRLSELGNTVPAFRNAAKTADQSNIHPALRTAARPADQIHPALRSASSSKPTDQSHIHPALRNTAWPSAEIHPALRNLPPAPAPAPSRPRRVSDLSQSSLKRDICSYLGYPLNYADSPRESEISAVNVTQKLPYASSRRRRQTGESPRWLSTTTSLLSCRAGRG